MGGAGLEPRHLASRAPTPEKAKPVTPKLALLSGVIRVTRVVYVIESVLA